MRSLSMWPILLSLAFFLILAESERIVSRVFTHNQPITDALPKNLVLSPSLKTVLELKSPSDFEEKFLKKRYTFKNQDHLLKALLHASYKPKLSKQQTASYEPLDVVGTVVIDYMLSRHLLLNMVTVNAETFSDMKNFLVSSDTLGFIALKNGLEQFVFVDRQLLNNTKLNSLREAVNKYETHQDMDGVIPVFGKKSGSGHFIMRIFKAVIGAVYVDSGYSIDTVSNVFIPIFKNEIDKLFSNVDILKQRAG